MFRMKGAHIGLAAASIFISLVAAELFVRVFYHEAANKKIQWNWHLKEYSKLSPSEEGLIVSHPVFGHVGNGSSVNNFGFSDSKPFPWSKDPSNFNIGLLGGSVAIQIFNQLKKELQQSKEVQRFQSLCGKNVVLHNLALGAGKQPQQLFIFQYFLDRIQMAVNLEGVNDVFFDPGPGVPSAFPSTTSLLFRMTEQRKEIVNKLREVRKQQVWILRASESKLANSALIRFLLNKRFFSLEQAYVREEDALRKSFPPIENGVFPEGKIRYKELTENWARYVQLQWEIAKAYKVPQIFLIQPSGYLPESKPMSEEEKKIALHSDPKIQNERREAIQSLYSRANELFRNRVPVKGLGDIFQKQKDQVYSDDCCHLNEKGISLLAEAVKNELQLLLPKKCK